MDRAADSLTMLSLTPLQFAVVLAALLVSNLTTAVLCVLATRLGAKMPGRGR